MRLDEFLADRQIVFERLHHQPVYTAQRRAGLLHVPGKAVAKSVLLRTDHGYLLSVLPASYRVDLGQLRRCLEDDSVEMASEAEMGRLFPDCERGAMPPFGSLYHLPTLVDEALAEEGQIVLETQNHEQAIRMTYHDFEALEHPRRGRFAQHG